VGERGTQKVPDEGRVGDETNGKNTQEDWTEAWEDTRGEKRKRLGGNGGALMTTKG